MQPVFIKRKRQMIKKSKRQKKYFAPQNENSEHRCDYPGCTKAGEYRAPKDARLKEYYWFCLEHVQEYNAKWNYYENPAMENDEEDISRRFRFSSRIKYGFGFDFPGGYNIFNDIPNSSSPNIRLTGSEREGLKIMELEAEDLSVSELKKAYKKAVKKYHPDININDKNAEEKFKIISTAYKSLLEKLS